MDRGDAWVRSVLVQAIKYAHDYSRADAYLGVFDVTSDGLAIAGDDPKGVDLLCARQWRHGLHRRDPDRVAAAGERA